MKRYEQYKDSGIAWLPKVPAHWEIAHLRKYLSLVSIKGMGDKQLLSVTREKGIIERNVDDQEENHNFVPDDLSGYKYVQPGQFVINKMKSWQGSYGVSDYEGIVSPAYYVCELDFPFKPFFSMAIRSRSYVDFFAQWSKGIRVGQWDLEPIALKSIPFFEPPVDEQKKIVEYLNKQITLIETRKCQRERELQTLNELKQAEIASVVTRGLNPNAPMKDSGIPWIGMIPAHWDTMRIRGLFKESDEKTVDDTGTLLSLSQYTGITLKSEAGKTGMFEAESTVGYKIVHPGQFVMNIMLAWNGSYAVSDLEGIISPAYCVFDFRIDCNKKYYDYLLRTKAYCGAFKTQTRGIIDSRLRLYPYKFYAFRTLVPPIEEQNAIVDYIESKTTKIDDMIESLKSEIERLTEYKQRLISDVVTGQINVQDEIL